MECRRGLWWSCECLRVRTHLFNLINRASTPPPLSPFSLSVSSFSLFSSCVQVQNESARMSSTAASSISVISASCLSVRCVLSHSIISHVNHSPHLLSSLCRRSLLSNIHLHFSSHRWDYQPLPGSHSDLLDSNLWSTSASGKINVAGG